MLRLLNIAIVVLLIAWVLGMIFQVVFGLLIHILLILAVVAIAIRLYYGVKKRREQARSTGRHSTV